MMCVETYGSSVPPRWTGKMAGRAAASVAAGIPPWKPPLTASPMTRMARMPSRSASIARRPEDAGLQGAGPARRRGPRVHGPRDEVGLVAPALEEVRLFEGEELDDLLARRHVLGEGSHRGAQLRRPLRDACARVELDDHGQNGLHDLEPVVCAGLHDGRPRGHAGVLGAAGSQGDVDPFGVLQPEADVAFALGPQRDAERVLAIRDRQGVPVLVPAASHAASGALVRREGRRLLGSVTDVGVLRRGGDRPRRDEELVDALRARLPPLPEDRAVGLVGGALDDPDRTRQLPVCRCLGRPGQGKAHEPCPHGLGKLEGQRRSRRRLAGAASRRRPATVPGAIRR